MSQSQGVITVTGSGDVPKPIAQLVEHLVVGLRKKGFQFRSGADALGLAAFNASLNEAELMQSGLQQYAFGVTPLIPLEQALLTGLQGNQQPSKMVVGYFAGKPNQNRIISEARNRGIPVFDLTNKAHLEKIMGKVRDMNKKSPIQALVASKVRR